MDGLERLSWPHAFRARWQLTHLSSNLLPKQPKKATIAITPSILYQQAVLLPRLNISPTRLSFPPPPRRSADLCSARLIDVGATTAMMGSAERFLSPNRAGGITHPKPPHRCEPSANSFPSPEFVSFSIRAVVARYCSAQTRATSRFAFSFPTSSNNTPP